MHDERMSDDAGVPVVKIPGSEPALKPVSLAEEWVSETTTEGMPHCH